MSSCKELVLSFSRVQGWIWKKCLVNQPVHDKFLLDDLQNPCEEAYFICWSLNFIEYTFCKYSLELINPF